MLCVFFLNSFVSHIVELKKREQKWWQKHEWWNMVHFSTRDVYSCCCWFECDFVLRILLRRFFAQLKYINKKFEEMKVRLVWIFDTKIEDVPQRTFHLNLLLNKWLFSERKTDFFCFVLVTFYALLLHPILFILIDNWLLYLFVYFLRFSCFKFLFHHFLFSFSSI